MDSTLLVTAALMGLGGSWHCALMCGPICAARPGWGLLVGRTLGYALVGAALGGASGWASNFVLRGAAGPWSPWLTVWALAHAAALSLGVFLLWQGRQPMWLALWGHPGQPGQPGQSGQSSSPIQAKVAVVRWAGHPSSGASATTLPTLLVGVAWAALPCGFLQSAWVVSALASGSSAGAAVMVVFSLCSAPGLLAAPALLRLLRQRTDGQQWQTRLTRLSGLLLAAASCWALGHGLWVHVREVC